MNEIHRRYHEVANIFPLMTGDDFEALKADIAANGQREPIWLHPDGSIIDGRNRHRACVELDIAPEFRTWNEQGSLVGFVVSLNLHRRHLDAGQRAMIALSVVDVLKMEIAEQRKEKARWAANVRWGNEPELESMPIYEQAFDVDFNAWGQKQTYLYAAVTGDRVKIGISDHPQARMKDLETANGEALSVYRVREALQKNETTLHAALSEFHIKGEWFRWCAASQFVIDDYFESMHLDHLVQAHSSDAYSNKNRDAYAEASSGMNVGRSSIVRAKQVREASPELAAKVTAGDMSLNAAYREVQHQQKRQSPPLPTDKYRVWYADPPWEYGNAGVIGESDNYGHAERHYPTMSIAELCAMGADIRATCEPDAVLFLWVTSPLLDECFPVIKAWGFEYKTSFVWDKVGHNYGHYNSVRHELLLVCTRGSCTPDNPKLYDSVISIEKSRKHSEKPEEFRAMIDDLYTNGKRIELFARCAADGWDAWGNEA